MFKLLPMPLSLLSSSVRAGLVPSVVMSLLLTSFSFVSFLVWLYPSLSPVVSLSPSLSPPLEDGSACAPTFAPLRPTVEEKQRRMRRGIVAEMLDVSTCHTWSIWFTVISRTPQILGLLLIPWYSTAGVHTDWFYSPQYNLGFNVIFMILSSYSLAAFQIAYFFPS